MGKTTLAQLAYNDERVRNHFDKKVWVCVSDPFDEVKIAKAIIENLDKNETQRNSDELETLILCIKSHVENKKFLLVLDDVWTDYETKWNNLKLPIIMQSCAKGSTMLVTTRKEGVAKMIMMRATGSMIHLDKLNDQDCLALFNSIAFLNREEDEANGFGDIGVEIVKKCRGLPLITKTLGSLVRDKKRKEEWRDVLNSKTWELEEVEEQVFRPLLLSYYDLAPPIKRCLLYCAIFPKDYELRKSDLIEMWMSQDYLNTKGNKGKRALGENYFESLAMRSFFQDFSKNEVGDVDGCKMHDIVHDFVQFLTKAECFIKEGADGGNERMELLGDEVRLLTLTNLPQGPLDTSFYGCQNMRTLAILESKITAISFDTIAKMKCLRTLNLTGNKLNELPEQIGELIHLRFMDLSRNEALKELPDAVCDLCNLQTLNVRVCEQLEKLPKAMGKLINLKHLYIGGCDELKYIPKGIRNLKSLQVLDWFYGCKSDDDEALKLEDLGMMDQLQGSLSIERFGNKDDDASQIAKAQLGNKEHLSELRVFFQEGIEEQRKGDEERLKALEPHQNLESLWIWDCHVGNADSLYWVKSLHNLRRVDLCDWGFCEVLPPLGKLPSLEVLEIKWMRMVKRVGVEFLGIEEEEEVSAGILFPKLKRLSFYGMNNWEEWEGISKDSCEITIMPRLSFLQINLSSRLKALPDFLYKIEALHTLKIKYCDILEEEHEKGVGKEWHKISHIPNLTIQNSTW